MAVYGHEGWGVGLLYEKAKPTLAQPNLRGIGWLLYLLEQRLGEGVIGQLIRLASLNDLLQEIAKIVLTCLCIGMIWAKSLF